jgi:hypothetical protein
LLAFDERRAIIHQKPKVIGVGEFMLTIDGNTTVRKLLTEHPSAFDVLVLHGMCQDCKDDPPLVPLQHFARKHCDGDLKSLIEQVESAIQRDDASDS